MGLSDLLPCAICPGIGVMTRSPGVVTGTDPKGPKPPGPVSSNPDRGRIMEWQWAQFAMYAHYYAHFKLAHPGMSFVLSEAEYAYIWAGLMEVDELLESMSSEFRREYSRGGRLRPDILGLSLSLQQEGPHRGQWGVLVELLEVTTYGQRRKTETEDIKYKLNRLQQIVRNYSFQVRNVLSAGSLGVFIGPSQWKPQLAFQRIVPLPTRTDKGTTYAEWICFQPTFAENDGRGIDGLLLYEVHSMPMERLKQSQLQEVLSRVAERERRAREEQQVPYGITLTPWLTTDYLNRHLLDRDELHLLALTSGVGALALLAYVALPVVAGWGVTEAEGMMGSSVVRGAGARVLTAQELAKVGTGLSAATQTAMQWMNALGRPVSLTPLPGHL